jgi:hypothetical protein
MLLVDAQHGTIVWEDILRITRSEALAERAFPTRYQLAVEDAEAGAALASFWRIFQAIRVYRQFGTAQAEAVYSALFTGWSIGMTWSEALDAALADTLADQLHIIARDEQRVLLAFLEHADAPERFAERLRQIVLMLPLPRQMAHLAHLRAAAPPAPPDAEMPPLDDTSAASITTAQAARLFDLGAPLLVDVGGLFARRLHGFVSERGI